MWWIAVAAAQSLDLAGLEQARRGSISDTFAALAHEKRVASISRLQQLMSLGVASATLAEMRLRLADLNYQEGVAGDPTALSAAKSLYEQILFDTPKYARADQVTFFLASSQWALGEVGPAVENWKTVVRAYPESSYVPQAYVHLGEAAFLQQDWFVAHTGYTKAATWTDGTLTAYAVYRAGWTAHRMGEVDGAVRSLQAASASADAHVSAAATADLRQLYPDVALPAPPPTIPDPAAAVPVAPAPQVSTPDCEAVERSLREQIANDPDRAPAHQLAIVQCWAPHNLPRATAELARLEATYGPRSAWAQGRSKEEVRQADQAMAEGRRAVR